MNPPHTIRSVREDVGSETTGTKCRREAETRSRSAGEWLLFAPTTKKDILSDILFVVRAIDGARTRGLDLGKVARYQLRHYRIRFVSDK